MFWTCHFDLSRSLFLICLEKPHKGQQENFLGCLITGKDLILLSTYFAKEATCHACINSIRPKMKLILKLIFLHFLSWTNWACCAQTQSCLSQTGKTIFYKRRKEHCQIPRVRIFFPFQFKQVPVLCCRDWYNTSSISNATLLYELKENGYFTQQLADMILWQAVLIKRASAGSSSSLGCYWVSQSLGDFNTICSTNSLILSSWKKNSNLKINLL